MGARPGTQWSPIHVVTMLNCAYVSQPHHCEHKVQPQQTKPTKRPPRYSHPLQYPVPHCRIDYCKFSPPPPPSPLPPPLTLTPILSSLTETTWLLRLPWPRPWYLSNPGCVCLTKCQLFNPLEVLCIVWCEKQFDTRSASCHKRMAFFVTGTE